MIQDVITALSQSLQNNIELIRQATQRLNEYRSLQGFCLILMEIVNNINLNRDIRQAALANLKLNIQKRWIIKKQQNSQTTQIQLSQNQKSIMRNFFLEALIRCNKDSKFLPLYKQIIRIVVMKDHLIWMPTSQIVSSLTNIDNIPAVLHFIIATSKSFQFSEKQSRIIFNKFIQDLSPLLITIANKYPTNQNIFLIVKCLWKFLNMELQQAVVKTLHQWIPIIQNVLEFKNQQIQNQVNSFTKGSNQFFYFHSKKWASRIIFRFFQRHASFIFDKKSKPFADHWYEKYAVSLIKLIVTELNFPNVIKAKYFQLKVILSVLYNRPQYVQQYVQQLLFSTLIPFLKLNPEDQKLSQEDPIQFLRKQQDPCQNFSNVKLAATQIWIGISDGNTINPKNKKTPSKYINNNMQYIRQKLTSGDLLEKQMAMYLICKLRTILLNLPYISATLPDLIDQYVIPEFKNPVMFLRARAVEMFSEYGFIKLNISVLRKAVQGIYECVNNDPHTVVKVKAACAFNCILKHKEAIQMVKPVLNNVLTTYVKLLDKYDMQNLVTSLQGIVSHFSQDISPFAVQLIYHLSNIFIKYCKTDKQKVNDQNYDGEVEMAAAGCLQAIKKIIDAPIPDASVNQVQHAILQILCYGFTNQGNDYIDDILNILSSYVYKCNNLGRQIWFFYPTIIYSIIGLSLTEANIENIPILVQNQSDILKNIIQSGPNSQMIELSMSVIRNFIYKGRDILMNTVDYLGSNLGELIFKIIDKTYQKSTQNDDFDDVDTQKCSATAILIYFIECINNIDSLIVLIWPVIKQNLKIQCKVLKPLNSQLIALCFYKFPQFASYIQENEQDGIQKSIADIIKNQKKYKDQWQKQRITLGLTALIASAQPSQRLLSQYPAIFKLLFRQIKQIHEIRKTSYNSDSQYQDESIDEDQQNIVLDDDSFGDQIWDQIHDSNYVTPLDSIDQIAIFQSTIKQIQANKPVLYSNLMGLLTQSEISELFKAIEQSKVDFVKRNQDENRNDNE